MFNASKFGNKAAEPETSNSNKLKVRLQRKCDWIYDTHRKKTTTVRRDD